LWCVEYDIIEESYLKVIESRNIDAGHKVLQIFAVPLEGKICESGKGRACRGRWNLGFRVRERSGGLELKQKRFEAGQCGEGGDHRVGWKVPGMRNVMKGDIDEESGRKK
jgi:hypothetical protein